ncbi:MAG: tetratricopeptide repeat protein [Mucilaginibacter sp.]|uniref:tetratricopeptide repeat protein n=1 Tax=Mucilaginibacter sp. TaxID=1882438 RepID=UPI003263FF80
MSKSNKNILFLALILLIALIAAYGNHFNNGFHFDDSHTVIDNVYIRDIKNIPAFYSNPKMFSADPAHWGLRPLVSTTLAIDYKLGGGLNPFYFQLSTFIWFTLLCVLLFFMYRNLLTQSSTNQWTGYIALGATAWYALHTANAETVNYVIARSDVLSTLCIVASFLIYVAYPAKRKWYLYIIPAIIGVFAKETVLMLLIILFFYILLFENNLSIADLFKLKNIKLVFNAIIKVLPLFVIVAAVQFYTLSKVTSIPNVTSPLFYYLLTQSYVWLHYVFTFFLPSNLSADSDWTVIQNAFDERIILGLVFIGLLIVTIFKTSVKKETRPIAFGLIWFAAALLPTSVMPFSEVTNDHRMFFAFVGLAFSVVTFIGLWLKKWQKQIEISKGLQVLVGTCILLVLGFNAYGVHQRNKVWKDEESLWLDVTLKSPLNGRGAMNYALTLMAKGDYNNALVYLNEAMKTMPRYSLLYINIAILKGATNKPDEAEANFKTAIQCDANSYNGYVYYGRWLKQVGRYTEAIAMAQKGLQINPNSVLALQILMGCYNQLGQWDQLRQAANQTLTLVPGDAGALTFLEAAKTHTTVVETGHPGKQQPTAADYLNQSLALYNQQKYTECIEACQQALKLKPDYADAYSNMGAAYNQLKQWNKGVEACEHALKIDPNHKLAHGNLNWAKNQLTKK